MPEDLYFIGDLYLRNGNYEKANQAFTAAILSRLVPGSQSRGLKNYIQPTAYSGYVQALSCEAKGDGEQAREALKNAMNIFQSEFSIEQIVLVDQLPGFFPRPKELMAKLAGMQVTLPDATTSENTKPFFLYARSVFDNLSLDLELNFDTAITNLLTQASNEEEAVECESLVWIGLLNVARQCIEIKDFVHIHKLLECISRQTQGLNCAPLYLPACLTELAIIAEEIGVEPEYCWLGLETVLLNFLDVAKFCEPELRNLSIELPAAKRTTFRNQIARAKILRFWSLVYLRSNDYARAEKILKRALLTVEQAAKLTSANGLSELFTLIHGDLAVVQISMSQSSDAELTIEKMFASPTSLFGKAYQIAEAYKLKGLNERGEDLLCRSVKLPNCKSEVFRRNNIFESGFHIWKLAGLSKHHLQYLDDAVRQFPANTLPTLLACMAGDYAVTQNLFYHAAEHYRNASRFSKEVLSGVAVAHLKGQILIKALNVVEQANGFSSTEVRAITTDLADVLSLTNRQLAIINYRRASSLAQGLTREWSLTSDNLTRLVAGHTDAEQRAWELELANQRTKQLEVRTEHYWINIAANELRSHAVDRAITHIEHAIEIYKLSTKFRGGFQPLLITQRQSPTELLRSHGLVADAEAYFLKTIAITTEKYGIDSEQESLCLAELANFYYISGSVEKTMSIVNEIMRAYVASLMLGLEVDWNGNALIHRLHQLVLQMTTGGHIEKAIEVLEGILKEEKKILPVDHADLLCTLLMLGKLRKENNEFELSKIIFKHVFQSPSRDRLHSIFAKYASDYCEVLLSLGEEKTAKKIKSLFSQPAEAEAAAPKPAMPDRPMSSEDQAWEELGSTKKAKQRYIKAVERVIEDRSPETITTEALDHLATFYVETNCLGQAAEIYLQLIERLEADAPELSHDKVLCFLSLARCYTRLCMYEEIPDLILQAKQADPEIHLDLCSIDTTLSYVGVAVEAHLIDSAVGDLKLAESLVDAQIELDILKKRDYLERIFHYWISIHDEEAAASTRAKLEQLPIREATARIWGHSKEESQPPAESAKLAAELVSTSPPPFAFLECLNHSFVNSSFSESPAYLYQKRIADKIANNWFPPVEKQPTLVQMQFAIAEDGRFSDLQQLTPSNNKYANSAVEEAIQSAAPFDSLPEEFGERALFQLTINDAKHVSGNFGITFESVE